VWTKGSARLLVEVLELAAWEFEGGHLRQHDLPAPIVDVRHERLYAVHRVERHLALVLHGAQWMSAQRCALRPGLQVVMQRVRNMGRGTSTAHLDLVEGVEQRVFLAELEDDLDDTAARGGSVFVSVFSMMLSYMPI